MVNSIRNVVALGITGVIVGVTSGLYRSDSVRKMRLISALEAPAVEEGTTPRPKAVELSLVYVGSSTCSWSRHPDLPELWHEATLDVSRQATDAQASVATVGVAIDWSIQSGLAHLSHVGDFDEVVVGRNWYGIGADRYLWSEFRGPSETPQIIVIENSRSLDPTQGVLRFSPDEQRLLGRYVGFNAIRDWVKRGAHVRGFAPD